MTLEQIAALIYLIHGGCSTISAETAEEMLREASSKQATARRVMTETVRVYSETKKTELKVKIAELKALLAKLCGSNEPQA